jgi:hypothetical protein
MDQVCFFGPQVCDRQFGEITGNCEEGEGGRGHDQFLAQIRFSRLFSRALPPGRKASIAVC